MSGSHTPGPWTALSEEVDKPYIRIRGTRLGGRYKVANVLTPVYEGVADREAQETRGNARLIAAAPELLDALKSLLEVEEGDLTGADFRCAINQAKGEARAAIAKATGDNA